MIKWIKDVDTGELIPVQDDFEYEAPAHLEKAEYTPVDYEKTTKMTIDELQNQLIAAQNEIEVIQQEKESTAVSEVTVKETYPETVTKKRFDFNLPKVIITIVVSSVCAVLVVLGFKFISDNDFVIDTSISENTESDYEFSPIYTPGSIPVYTGEDGTALYINSSSSKSDVNQESEQESQQETEQDIVILLINILHRILSFIIPLFVSIIALKFVIKLFRNSCY